MYIYVYKYRERGGQGERGTERDAPPTERPARHRRFLQRTPALDQFFKLPALLKLTNTDPFAAWFVVIGDTTPVVRSVLGAIGWDSHLPRNARCAVNDALSAHQHSRRHCAPAAFVRPRVQRVHQ